MITAVAGGGYSGFVCACLLLDAGIRVRIFERQEKVLKKLMISGNGRCNISNEDIKLSDYICKDKERLAVILDAFSREKEMAFFKAAGIETFSEDGRIYPFSGKASSVYDALRAYVLERGGEIITDTCINGIAPVSSGFVLTGDASETVYDKVMICCGGCAGIYDEENKGGVPDIINRTHAFKYEKTRPALTRIYCKNIYGTDMKKAEGTRIKGKVYLLSDGKEIYSEYGEIQFIKGGLSGIPVFNCSLYLDDTKNTELFIDLIPDMDLSYIEDRAKRFGKRQFETFFYGLFTEAVAGIILSASGIPVHKKVEDATEDELLLLYNNLKSFKFKELRTDTFKNSQLSVGGIALCELSDELEIPDMKGIYIAGEALAVSGKCGGYNLHFAAASAAYIAGAVIKNA